MRISIRTQDTRNNNEDFALTPFVFLINAKVEHLWSYGFGLCWGYWAIGLSLINLPNK